MSGRHRQLQRCPVEEPFVMKDSPCSISTCPAAIWCLCTTWSYIVPLKEKAPRDHDRTLSTVPCRKHLRWDLPVMPVILEAIRTIEVKKKNSQTIKLSSNFQCKFQMGNFVPFKETRSLKMVCVLKTLLSQVPSNGYGTADGTSWQALIGEGSSRVLTTANWILQLGASEVFLNSLFQFNGCSQ